MRTLPEKSTSWGGEASSRGANLQAANHARLIAKAPAVLDGGASRLQSGQSDD